MYIGYMKRNLSWKIQRVSSLIADQYISLLEQGTEPMFLSAMVEYKREWIEDAVDDKRIYRTTLLGRVKNRTRWLIKQQLLTRPDLAARLISFRDTADAQDRLAQSIEQKTWKPLPRLKGSLA